MNATADPVWASIPSFHSYGKYRGGWDEKNGAGLFELFTRNPETKAFESHGSEVKIVVHPQWREFFCTSDGREKVFSELMESFLVVEIENKHRRFLCVAGVVTYDVSGKFMLGLWETHHSIGRMDR